MSRQRDILPEVVDELAAAYPRCAMLLGGSVSAGEERPNSDLDLFVVFEGDGAIRLDQESQRNGVALDTCYLPTEGFWAAWTEKPYNFWMFAWADILVDPTGIGKACQEPARQYVLDHPAITRLWETQTADFKRHRQDPTHPLDFATWDTFAQHLEEQVARLGDAHWLCTPPQALRRLRFVHGVHRA